MATTSPQNKAIIKLGAGKSTVTNTAIPTLRDEYMIVKTAAVALNPADWQGLDQEGDEGTISGMDFAGVVVEVGSKVKKDFKKGDRVLGCSVGGNASLIQQGAFAEFILVKGDLQFHIPDKMSFEEAATYGVAIATNALGLYDQLKLPLPVSGKQETGDTALLVYGGSTAMGTMAIQFAKLSGFSVVATCSSHNFELVKSYGASVVFDYHDPDCGNKIKDYTKDSLTLILDSFASPEAVKICEKAMSSKGGAYCTISPVEVTRNDFNVQNVLGYKLCGESFTLHGNEFPAHTELYQWYADVFAPLAQKLLDEGKIKSHPVSVREGGLNGVIDGLQQMREWKVSGQKLVYRITDTK